MEKIIIYTDGACSGNQNETNFGGWGVVLRQGKNTKKLFGGAVNTTNNKMELQGAIEGLKALNKTNIPVELYSDSNYVIQGITTWIHGWKKKGWKNASKKPVENKELWIELDRLKSKFKDIQFIKVKGHNGVELNELADDLASKGVDLARNGESKETTKEENAEVKTVSLWDKLKLQIDNLEIMYGQHTNGENVSSSVYWQVETINEILKGLEGQVGADKVRISLK
ncbi:ribonuclease HI [Lysinibacillus fusiformis]|uniref:ribonuclease HI n=1 Tax=Lysinibacillus fusiformis TaxID=28031 RepID=UPI00263B4A31|nr:ribonuclease HI [Lysinibacillus fusiformis]MDC6267259.1 ribonuclease HI [Lysinibacillus sphaericus]MDN4968307.1 ribonuclease HI [Lysinibacillus fusiformis]MDN4968481.1 ribonuclease HI [Lysinibacillus fusiformis]